METSIRFVRVGNSPGKDGKETFRTLKPALCFRGRKRCHAVINDDTRVRVVSNLSLQDHDHSSPVTFQHAPYPIPRIVDHFTKLGQRKGITARAKFFLEHALNGGVDEDDALPPDEIAGAAPEAPEEPGMPVKRSPSTPKPAKPASESRSAAAGPSRTAGADIVRKLASELKLEPTKLRKLLRSKGLRAPYDDEKKIREALK